MKAQKTLKDGTVMVIRSVFVPLELWERLEALAERNDRTITRELRRAVDAHVKRQPS